MKAKNSLIQFEKDMERFEQKEIKKKKPVKNTWHDWLIIFQALAWHTGDSPCPHYHLCKSRKRSAFFHLCSPCVVTPDSFKHDLFLPNDGILSFFLSLLNIINLFDTSLPNLYFHSIRSMTIFLKDLNKVNFRALTQT